MPSESAESARRLWVRFGQRGALKTHENFESEAGPGSEAGAILWRLRQERQRLDDWCSHPAKVSKLNPTAPETAL
jgi:hypothetical protein